jgi:RNA polymerase sigma-70 factor (ECF subfamily)
MAEPPLAARFPTTHWSRVVAAGDRAAPEAREALAELCRAYWYPLYAFVRRKGHGPEDAQDLVQGFFAALLEHDGLAALDRDQGRFRAFLIAACDHYLSNQIDRRTARKRGGGRLILSIDGVEAEGRYGSEPAHELTAERLYQRRWATTLLERVLATLEAEMLQAGKVRLFEALRPALLAGRNGCPMRGSRPSWACPKARRGRRRTGSAAVTTPCSTRRWPGRSPTRRRSPRRSVTCSLLSVTEKKLRRAHNESRSLLLLRDRGPRGPREGGR